MKNRVHLFRVPQNWSDLSTQYVNLTTPQLSKQIQDRSKVVHEFRDHWTVHRETAIYGPQKIQKSHIT